jgi:biopolymer transport protein TolR
MVPFIDVMLVLLIIFMVTAPLMAPSVIDIPSVGKAAAAPDQVITIEIDKTRNHGEVTQQHPTSLEQMSSNPPPWTTSLPCLATSVWQSRHPRVISADKQIAYEQRGPVDGPSAARWRATRGLSRSSK